MSKLNKKQPYPYNDVVVFEKVESEIHFQYIRNERGEYISPFSYTDDVEYWNKFDKVCEILGLSPK